MIRSAYWAPQDFEAELTEEVGGSIIARHGRLVLSSAEAKDLVWAHNVWTDARAVPIKSIAQGAKTLRALTKRWAQAPVTHVRRGALIEESMGSKRKPQHLEFLGELPEQGPGSFSLLSHDMIIASPTCTSLVANGEPQFDENKVEPPSRAYLKLWELMTLFDVVPEPGSLCVDLGACPGGWTWVLSELGVNVIAVDRSPLADVVTKRRNVRAFTNDAFKLEPSEAGDVDWLFSDMICEPAKLLTLVRKWMDSGRCKNFVCTIKFKGKTDFDVLNEFLSIQGSRAKHLFHNKHEVTWWLQR